VRAIPHGAFNRQDVLVYRTYLMNCTDAALTFDYRNHRGRSMPVQVRRLWRLLEERKASSERQRPEGTGWRTSSQSECPSPGLLIIISASLFDAFRKNSEMLRAAVFLYFHVFIIVNLLLCLFQVADEFVKRRGDTEWFHLLSIITLLIYCLDNFSPLGVNRKRICSK